MNYYRACHYNKLLKVHIQKGQVHYFPPPSLGRADSNFLKFSFFFFPTQYVFFLDFVTIFAQCGTCVLFSPAFFFFFFFRGGEKMEQREQSGRVEECQPSISQPLFPLRLQFISATSTSPHFPLLLLLLLLPLLPPLHRNESSDSPSHQRLFFFFFFWSNNNNDNNNNTTQTPQQLP